ncbi:MAG TPA: aldehyde ferredoxin oxidoreductase family protein [Planctomycetaceae bacterium]|nr:aldehyde ferredoxin oxidoreductase family protein [Planctomycetaceae bacterium]
MFGYHGRYLRIDLSARTTESVDLDPALLRRFVGGSGLGTALLLSETPADCPPLSPAAPLAFVFSPLVGSPLTTSAKFAVMARSPLTGRINDSLSSSHFAIAGKKTGYDALVIVGQAETPTCLVIDSEGVRFEDAADVWGVPSSQAAEQLSARLGPGYRLAAIGPAGEKLVRYATVSHDGRHAGRGGIGAVMGAKRLKAVAVAGHRQVEFADVDGLLKASKDLSRRSFGPATAKYRELGTMSNLLVFNRLGALPTRNFQSGEFADALQIAPEALAANRERMRKSCAACTIGCEHLFRIRGGDHDNKAVRMEYQNLYALGPLCGISDPEMVLEASRLCDELGIDTISAGGTIAFAMECVERGLLNEPDLVFGNGARVLQLLREIAEGRGLGALLAQGSRAAAEQIGGGSADFAPHVKGLELPGYEPRALQTMALGFAVGARGADHNRSGAYQVDLSEHADRFASDLAAVPLAIETEDEAAIIDSLILCKFVKGVFDDRLAEMAGLLHSITGWDMTADELRAVARRIITAKKFYNIRQGWTPAEDTLPARFFTQALPTGASAGAQLSRERLERQIEAYNLARGWSAEGWIPSALLAEMQITAAR